MQKSIITIIIGIIINFILFNILASLETIFPLATFYLPNPFHEGNGFMSYGGFLSYFISGVAVGFIAKKSPITTAIISGITAWLLLALIELPDWPYYLRYAPKQYHPHYFTSDSFTLLYYLKLAIAMSILFGIGGFIGKVIKTSFKAK